MGNENTLGGLQDCKVLQTKGKVDSMVKVNAWDWAWPFSYEDHSSIRGVERSYLAIFDHICLTTPFHLPQSDHTVSDWS